jgi:hypothetical protein
LTPRLSRLRVHLVGHRTESRPGPGHHKTCRRASCRWSSSWSIQTGRRFWINHAEVYPEGLALEVHLCGHEEAPEGVEAGPGSWRFGVQFSDERKAAAYGLGMFARMPAGSTISASQSTSVTTSTSTSAVAAPAGSPSPPPASPVLRGLGGGGSRSAWRQNYWLWPLPPAGELILACEWPDLEIAFTTRTMSTDRLLAAAGRARHLWRADSTP